MTTRDRLVRGQAVSGAFGPMELPGREALVGALRRIAALGPHTRVGLGFDPGGKHWTWDPDAVDDLCDEMVVSIAPATRDTIKLVTVQQASLLDADHPLRFVLAGDYLIQVNDHAVGDGVVFLDRMEAVLQFAAGNTTVPAWLAATPLRFPLLVAAREAFMRKSGGFSALIEARRSDRAKPRETVSGPLVDWHPDPTLVITSAPATTLKSLQKWIRETDRTQNLSTVLMILLRHAFESTGISVQHDTDVVYDLRRYLSSGKDVVEGNFIAGLPLRVADPDNIASVGAELKVHLESGRPLAAQLVGIARDVVFGTRSTIPSQVRAEPRALLIYNNMAMPRSLQRMPWKAPPEGRTSFAQVSPGGPEDMVVIVIVVAGVIHLGVSFHGNVFDEDVVERAMQLAMNHPLSFLESHAGA